MAGKVSLSHDDFAGKWRYTGILIQRNQSFGEAKKTGLLLHRPVEFVALRQKPYLAGANVGRFHPLAAFGGVELNLLAVTQGAEAFGRKIAVMHKQIFAAIIGSNKTKTFFLVEPLDCTATHMNLLGSQRSHIANPSLFQLYRTPRELDAALF